MAHTIAWVSEQTAAPTLLAPEGKREQLPKLLYKINFSKMKQAFPNILTAYVHPFQAFFFI